MHADRVDMLKEHSTFLEIDSFYNSPRVKQLRHRIVDIFADLLKKKNWNITWS